MVACIICLAGASSAVADELSFLPDRGDANLTFYLDNDLFTGTDENYTNGARLSWISGRRDPERFGRLQRMLKKLSGDAESLRLFRRLSGFSDPNEVDYNYGFSATQLMFTPRDPLAPQAPEGQRPYAGWLGIDVAIQSMDAQALNAVSLALGTTGPNALARETQDFFHERMGVDKFRGWDSQIPNELTVNLYLLQRRRLVLISPNTQTFAVDGFTEARVALGNFLTAASFGSLIRFGWNLPVDFSDARLSVTGYSHQPFTSERQEQSKWSLFGMVGAQGSVIGHDVSLDGPVFRNFDTGASSRTWVGELYAGFGVRYRRLYLSYVHTFRSKEFYAQQDAPAFGSLTVGYRM